MAPPWVVTCRCSVDDVCPQGKTGGIRRCSIVVGSVTPLVPSQELVENTAMRDNLESISDELQTAVTELVELQEEIRKIRDIINYSGKTPLEKIKEIIDGD